MSGESALNMLRAFRSMYSRFPAILLLTAVIPLATSLFSYAPTQMSVYKPDCQPSMQNTYPAKAASGQVIVITTTITNVCLSTLDYTQVIVDIMLPNTSVILSSAVATSTAVNKITAPPVGGPWTLDVVVSFNDYPLTGTLASFQNTITIYIVGPLASSTTKSSTVASTIAARSSSLTSSKSSTSKTIATLSPVEITNSTTSMPVVASSATPSQLLSTTSITTNSMSSTLTPFSVQYLWQGWNGMLILASVVVILLCVVFVRIRRRKSE